MFGCFILCAPTSAYSGVPREWAFAICCTFFTGDSYSLNFSLYRTDTTRVDQGGVERPPYAYDTKRKVRGVVYAMQKYVDECITVYCEVTGTDPSKIKPAPTPFIDEALDPCGVTVDEDTPSVDSEAVELGSKKKKKKKAKPKPATKVGAKAKAKPLTAKAKAKLKAKADEKPLVQGELQPVAAKVLMKIMYLARFARFDLLRAVSALSTFITKWGKLQDKKLYRIIRYLKFSREYRQIGFIGDNWKDIGLCLFTDSDFAGDQETKKSCSGVFLGLYGPNTFYPLQGI